MMTLDAIETLSSEDKRLLVEVKSAVRRSLPTATVLLYGSAARGAKTAGSDFDVFILTEEPLSAGEEDTVRGALFDIELAKAEVITALFCSRDEWDSPLERVTPFHREVERDAIEL